MEPLSPEIRLKLKLAHPGLADQEIDRSEELIAQLHDLNPTKDPERIAKAEKELKLLLRERMPRYSEVVRDLVAAQRQEAEKRVRSVSRVTWRKEQQT